MKSTLISLALFFGLTHSLLAGGQVTLDVDQDSIIATNNTDKIDFIAEASDGIEYSGRFNCMDFRDPLVANEGIIYVLKGESHMGVKALMPYGDCLQLFRKFLADEGVLKLSWDQDQFDDLITGSLSWSYVGLNE